MKETKYAMALMSCNACDALDEAVMKNALGYCMPCWAEVQPGTNQPSTDLERKDMSKHSPGPWRIHTSDTEPYRWAQIRFKDPRNPRFELAVGQLGGWGTSCEENKANARLIAAAPELLRAAQLLLLLSSGEGCATGESVMLAPKTREQLEHAIAKAEGRS